MVSEVTCLSLRRLFVLSPSSLRNVLSSSLLGFVACVSRFNTHPDFSFLALMYILVPRVFKKSHPKENRAFFVDFSCGKPHEEILIFLYEKKNICVYVFLVFRKKIKGFTTQQKKRYSELFCVCFSLLWRVGYIAPFGFDTRVKRCSVASCTQNEDNSTEEEKTLLGSAN